MLNRPIYNYNPQDVGQPRGIGISILFNNGTNIFNTTYTTKDQVKSNLVNYILTNKGERFFYPEFGGNLRASLFEQDTTFDTIATILRNEILAYVPNIIIKDIQVNKFSNENLVNIIIDYSINNQTDNLVINVSTQDLIQQ